ncbi:hypothetical protein BC830DRAFT_1175588, partial [Chytriomyces sp. MP71]
MHAHSRVATTTVWHERVLNPGVHVAPYTATVASFLVKQGEWTSQLLELNQMGRELFERLYAHRSCHRAIPQVQTSHTPEQAAELRHLTTQVLQPVVTTIKEFMAFRDASTHMMIDILAPATLTIHAKFPGIHATDHPDLFCHESLLEALARVLDLFVMMDAIKDVKGGMRNDFSLFKRCTQDDSPETLRDFQLVYLFLGQLDPFCGQLKRLLREHVPRFENILLDLIEIGSSKVVDSTGLDIPGEKHMWLKAIAASIVLVDDNHNEMTKRKAFNTNKVVKLLKADPLVQFLPDMSLQLANVYKNAPQFAAAAERVQSGPSDRASGHKDTHCITRLMEFIHSEYSYFSIQYDVAVAEVEFILKSPNLRFKQSHGETVVTMVLGGLSLMARCNKAVHEHIMWKHANPVKSGSNGVPQEALDYEL